MLPLWHSLKSWIILDVAEKFGLVWKRDNPFARIEVLRQT